MSTAGWIMVLVMEISGGTAAVTIPFATEAACQQAMIATEKEMWTYKDVRCFQPQTGKSIGIK